MVEAIIGNVKHLSKFERLHYSFQATKPITCRLFNKCSFCYFYNKCRDFFAPVGMLWSYCLEWTSNLQIGILRDTKKLRLGAEEEIYSFDTAILISKPIIPESQIIDVLEQSIFFTTISLAIAYAHTLARNNQFHALECCQWLFPLAEQTSFHIYSKNRYEWMKE